MDNQDNNLLGAIAGAVGAAAGAGAIQIGIPVAAPGILGAIGLTTTATITVPAAAVVGVVAGVSYLGYKAHKHFNNGDDDKRLPRA
ncbi:hypothetical protein A6S26_07680 [Nostoc sp. ATCC 43529]|nr:hypothetical protein A6S26_07680 [Nostoc sp. ATCC 43529]